MKKIISILACVCLLLSVMIIPVSAEEITATISFADASARVEWDSNHQIWQQNGITITNYKTSTSTAIADYVPARFYAHSELIIEYPGMTKIVAEASGSKYVFADSSVLDVDATISVSGTTTTITFAEPVDKVTVTDLGKQWRATTMTVYAVEQVEEEVFEGTDPEAPIELAVNETVPATLKEIKVPAEGTVFVKAADANGILHVTSATGSYMLINGMANQATADAEYDLTLCGYEMVNIYNPGEATITLYVFLEEGVGPAVGTWDNPEVLELKENPYMPQFPPSAEAQTELEAGNQGYFYKITATEDCIFVINISAVDAEWNSVGYQYSITNNTTGWQSDFVAKAADVEDYYDSSFLAVSAGDELLINAGTFDAANVWNAPAGTLNVRINVTNVGASEYPEILEETGTYTATVEEGSQGYYYEWTAPADGTVTITMNDESWTYVVNNLTAYDYGDIQWSDSDPVLSSYEVKVKAGDLLSIQVNTYDAENPWNAPAGTVNWTLDFAEVVFGDADGDGDVSAQDYVKLMQYLNEWDGVEVDEFAADVNGDGKLNGRDIALLLQYLNGWEVELG